MKICEQCEVMKKALEEISLGRGRFDRDPSVHAMNCIEDMKETAKEALRQSGTLGGQP